MATTTGKKTGGRKKGVPNKATADVKAAAQKHGAKAIETLAKIMSDTKSPVQARVAAANAILDRGYGKAPQAITGEDGGPISIKIVKFTDA